MSRKTTIITFVSLIILIGLSFCFSTETDKKKTIDLSNINTDAITVENVTWENKTKKIKKEKVKTQIIIVNLKKKKNK